MTPPPTGRGAEQVATIATLQTEVRGIHGAIDELKKGQTRLVADNAKAATSIAELSASVKALIDRDQTDIQELFRLNDEGRRSLAKVKENHIPESEIRAEFRRTNERIASLNSRVNWILGMGATVVVAIEVVKAVLTWVK